MLYIHIICVDTFVTTNQNRNKKSLSFEIVVRFCYVYIFRFYDFRLYILWYILLHKQVYIFRHCNTSSKNKNTRVSCFPLIPIYIRLYVSIISCYKYIYEWSAGRVLFPSVLTNLCSMSHTHTAEAQNKRRIKYYNKTIGVSHYYIILGEKIGNEVYIHVYYYMSRPLKRTRGYNIIYIYI